MEILIDYVITYKGGFYSQRVSRDIRVSLTYLGFAHGTVPKNPLLPMQEMKETWVPPLGPKDPLGEEMATHSSILAWKIPWTEEPGRL